MNRVLSVILVCIVIALGVLWIKLMTSNELGAESSNPISTSLPVFSPYSIFHEADSFYIHGDIEKSILAYQATISENKTQAREERLYGLNQLSRLLIQYDHLQEFENWLPALDSIISSGIENRTLGGYYFNKGNYFRKKGAVDSSILNLNKALFEYREQENQHQDEIAKTLFTLGLTYKYLTPHVDSFLYYNDQGYEMLNKYENSLSPTTIARGYYSKAHSCWVRRAHQEGILLCDLAIQKVKETGGWDTLFVAKCLSLKGRFLRKEKETRQLGEDFLFEAVNLVNGLPDYRYEKQILYRNLLGHLARIKDSLRLFSTLAALEKNYSPHEFQYIHPSGIKGIYYAYTQQPSKSIKWFSRFLASMKGIKDLVLLDEAYYFLITENEKRGNLEMAEEFVWRTLALKMGKRGKGITLRDLFEKANANRLHIYFGYHLLANLYLKQYQHDYAKYKKLEKAFHLYQFADSLAHAKFDSFDEDAWLSVTKMYNAKMYSSAVEVSFELYQIKKDYTILSWGHHFLERMKAALYYQELTNNLSNGASKDVMILLEKARLLQYEIRASKRTGNDEKDLSSLLYQQEELNKRLKKLNPAFFELKTKQSFLQLEDFRTDPSRDSSVFLNYLKVKDNFYLIFIHPDTLIFHRIYFNEKAEQQVTWLSKYLSNQDLSFKSSLIPRFCETAKQLFKRLIGPIESHLKGITELIIIPDGDLNWLPFEVLLTDTLTKVPTSFKKFPYLVNQYTVSYASSVKSWLINKEELKYENPSILAYAFSEGGTPIAGVFRSRRAWSELPGTAIELRAIEQAFPNLNSNSIFRFGKNANLKSFKKDQLRRFDIAHFALHARSDNTDRLNNALFFPGNPVDSMLGYEITAQGVDAKLVVLASCQTALGKLEYGEGVYNLSRSFLLAGAQSVISSRWEIDDQATSKIVALFYQQLSQGLFVPIALRQAKIQYLNQSTNAQAHPHNWAGLSYAGG